MQILKLGFSKPQNSVLLIQLFI